MTELKEGDRVKVTYEGTVDWVSKNAVDFTLDGNDFVELSTIGAKIEKLQDPEPTWVNGDVIKVPDDERAGEKYICLRIPGGWVAQDGGLVQKAYVSRMWAEGKLDALLKQHA